MDQNDLWNVNPRQVVCIMISTAFVVVSRIGYLCVVSVLLL